MKYTICLIGDRKVGKTSWLERLSTGNFISEYKNSDYFKVYYIEIYFHNNRIVNKGYKNCHKVIFEIYEMSLNQDMIYTKYDAYIFMFDLKNQESYDNIKLYYQEHINKDNTNNKYVLLGNKSDIKNRAVKRESITFHVKDNIKYYEISVKNFCNVSKPFQYLYKSFNKRNQILKLE